MQANSAVAEKNRQSGIEKIVEMLNRDTIYFPKTILRSNVYEESKMLFSIIFTSSLQNCAEGNNISLTVSKEMKKMLKSMTDDDIQLNCYCPKSKVRTIRSEVLYLINHGKIYKCICETGKGEV